MTTERKARAYDEALEKARKLRNEYNEIEGCYSNQWLCEELFPELAESEDEKIRKAIIEHLKHGINEMKQSKFKDDYRAEIEDLSKYIAWLEKQKPVEWTKEDENCYNEVVRCIEQSTQSSAAEHGLLTWLKSLHPQKHWNPSKEQMNALEHFVRSIGESGYISSYDRHTKTIYSLLDDLKKL